MERVALLELGMMPWDFMRLTPQELTWLLEGKAKSQKRSLRERAWTVHNLLVAWMKQPPSIAKLMGEVVGGKERSQE